MRQILTLMDNVRLTRRQADALDRLEIVNRRVEEQARLIAERNIALEKGVAELKDVQARLANGNLRARAPLTGGELLPLAISLNLLADRLMHREQAEIYLQRLIRALAELSIAIERYRFGGPLIIPPRAAISQRSIRSTRNGTQRKDRYLFSQVFSTNRTNNSTCTKLKLATLTSRIAFFAACHAA